jgi:DNA-binding XRE family transcriptional regulator
MNPIREIRQRTGMTQEAFAKHMQVTRTALTRMEGRAKPARILVLAAERVEQIAPENPTRDILP